ncbi:ABC transporter integral membrane protein [Streptomyces ambofaciens ATCC 23877]|uniref:Transport permease protein n=1 Tax=Streptomyces ambofaciens (strain ATCC 23877 / 3486 / DSM 40053 / JCM 4204 / NBRC 12836 / NRRL B-2516) TaxID=278992 RepID=A0A0K2AT27_STRA7|nr:ABC transporter permease [Streptomyces ambofaciens]AKZ56076.1 ABC transporter integral membrane protein [Streptomyces ambofaciens ATCC 23877]
MSQVLDTPPPTPAPAAPPGDLDLAALAARHGLSVSGARPSLPQYVRQLWARRHFIGAFATAKLTAQYSQAKLGQLWQVMTPLLNAAVYYFIFGVLMNTKQGVDDFVPFLVTGVFVWTFTQSSIMAGTKAVSGNLGLVRALHFPRAALPVSFCLQQLQQLLFSMAALVVILLAFGVPPAASWVLAVPALVLQFVFNAGVALVMARVGSKIPDMAQLMPFLLRTWMYGSGVMFSIHHMTGPDSGLPSWIGPLLQVNPAVVYIDLMRFALIDSFGGGMLPDHVWALALGWALVAGIGGFIYFWKAEETYGRG